MSTAHDMMLQSFANPDPHSVGLYNLLKEIYPNFAKQLFHRNPFMQKVVLSGFNPMEMLEYPICGRCETLAAWDLPVVRNGKRIPACSCLAEGCGHKTLNPITLRAWMLEELKHKAPPDIADIAEVAVDLIAMKMSQMAMRDYQSAVLGIKAKQNDQSGIVGADGTALKSDNQNPEKQIIIEEEVRKIREKYKKENMNHV